jgi:hypothetical protein
MRQLGGMLIKLTYYLGLQNTDNNIGENYLK